jgi:hypothetical protein
MCSSTDGRLARIYRAIEELENLGAGDRGVEIGGSAGVGGGADADRGDGQDVAGSPTASGRAAGPVGESAAGAEREADTDADVTSRLAEIWAMIADADPELAKRLPRYLGPNS